MKNFVQIKKQRYLLLYLIALVPFLIGIAYMIGFNQAHAAVTLDTTSSPPNNTAKSFPFSWQHTTGTGSNRILLVGLNCFTLGGITVKLGSTSLTQLKSFNYTGGQTIYVW
ncbi:MAG: hypothetical protein ACREHC_04950, partial [Candidatus Levyibacteriota bacterium]